MNIIVMSHCPLLLSEAVPWVMPWNTPRWHDALVGFALRGLWDHGNVHDVPSKAGGIGRFGTQTLIAEMVRCGSIRNTSKHLKITLHSSNRNNLSEVLACSDYDDIHPNE
jgi:hypothetical protein